MVYKGHIIIIIIIVVIIMIIGMASCIKRSCDIVFMKMKVTWCCLRKTISGSSFKQNYSDLVFQIRTICLKWESPLLATFFCCWKDDVVTFIAQLNVTIKHLTRYKQNILLAAMLEGKSMPSSMAANTNQATLLKNQNTIKYLP